MRVSSMQISQQGAASLSDLGRQVAETQKQIASGRRIVEPGDDPVGAARVVKINQELQVRAQYRRNIDSAEAQLGQAEVVLTQVMDVMQRIRELALQASNGVPTMDDRRFIAQEISARFDELVSLVNSRGPNGEYLFAGFQSQVKPFEVQGDEVVFNGDQGQRMVEIAAGQLVPVTDSGRDIFVEVESATPVFAVTAHPDNDPAANASIASAGITDREALADFYPDDLIIEFRPLDESPTGSPNFTVRRASDNRVVDGLENVSYASGSAVEAAGMSFRISGYPAPGDRFMVETTTKRDVLSTVKAAATGLAEIDPVTNRQGFDNLVADTLTGIDNAISRVLEVRSDLGARMNTVDSTRNLHQNLELQAQEVLSDVRDLDFAEAVSRLSFQSFLLEAAQQSYVRVSGLSLFNVL